MKDSHEQRGVITLNESYPPPKRRTRFRALATASAGLVLALGTPSALLTSVAEAAGWQSQTFASLGMHRSSVYVAASNGFGRADARSAVAAGIPPAHVVISTELGRIPDGSDVIVLGGTAAMPTTVSRYLTGKGDTVLQLGGATYRQTDQLLLHLLFGNTLGELLPWVNRGADRGSRWRAGGNPYAGQGEVFHKDGFDDGVSLYQPYAFLPAPTVRWNVELTGNPTSLPAGEPTTLTAKASASPIPASGSSHLFLNIIDTTTHTVIGECPVQGACDAVEEEPSPATQAFVADVGPRGALPGSQGVLAESLPIQIVWTVPPPSTGVSAPPISVTLHANPTVLLIGWPTTLSVVADNMAPGDWLSVQGSDGWRYSTTNAVYSTVQAVYAPTTVNYTATVKTAGGETVATAPPVSVTWQGWPVEITATPANLPMGKSTSLTATSKVSVSNSGYALEIEDVTTGKVLKTCLTGSVCQATFTQNTAGSQQFEAMVGTPDGATILTRSSRASVTWWSVVLTTSSSLHLLVPTPATVTATASPSVSGSGYELTIWNITADQPLAATRTGHTVTATYAPADPSAVAAAYGPTMVTFEAVIGPAGTNPTSPDAVAVSNSLRFGWLSNQPPPSS